MSLSPFSIIIHSLIAAIGCIILFLASNITNSHNQTFLPELIIVITAMLCTVSSGLIGYCLNSQKIKNTSNTQSHAMKMYLYCIDPLDGIFIIIITDLFGFIIALWSIHHFQTRNNSTTNIPCNGIANILTYFAMTIFMCILHGVIGLLTNKLFFIKIFRDLSCVSTVGYMGFVYFNIFWIRNHECVIHLVSFVVMPILLSMLMVYNSCYVNICIKTLDASEASETRQDDDLENQQKQIETLSNNLYYDSTILYVMACLSCFAWP
eukprot:287328_1